MSNQFRSVFYAFSRLSQELISFFDSHLFYLHSCATNHSPNLYGRSNCRFAYLKCCIFSNGSNLNSFSSCCFASFQCRISYSSSKLNSRTDRYFACPNCRAANSLASAPEPPEFLATTI